VQGQEGHVAGVDGTGAGDGEVGKGGGCVGEAVPDLPEVADEEVLGYGSGVDADALADGDEVGGDEEAGLAREGGWGSKTVVVEDGVGEGAGGAFAFCASDVDDVEAGEVGGLLLGG
jgi:hypothetical protein